MKKQNALRALALAGAMFFAAGAARAQTQTNVTATVKDTAGIPYANGRYTIQLVPSGGAPTVNGAQINGSFNGSTDANGSFNVSLWPNASIVTNPVGTSQWQFTVCVSPGVLPPLGIGGACTPPTSVTISGASQSLSSTLSAVAPALTYITLGGSGSLSCSIAAAVLFETAANTGGCATGFTFSTPNLTIPATGAYQINGAQALAFPVAANSNLAVGPNTLGAVTTGVNNLGVGAGTLTLTTTGNSNTAIGVGALGSAGATNQKNTAVGHATLGIVTSDSNVGIGENVLPVLTSGSGNVAVGAGAGGNTTGSNNTFLGANAGLNDTSGGSNVIIGSGLGNAVSSGTGNVVIGVASLSGITGTSSNQLDIMDVIIGTGMGTPATSTVEYKGSLTVDGTCTGCGGGTPAFPVTVTGGVSGAVPCFTSTTVESAGTLLATHAIAQGGGAGACPSTGNGDFTVDSTAHTLLAGAAGLADFSAETGSNALKIPTQAGCTAGSNGAMCFNTTTSNLTVAGNVYYKIAAVPGTNCLMKNGSASGAILACSALVDAGTNVVSSEPVSATQFKTATNCAANGTAANPSVVSCSSAAAGMFSCATNASTGTCTVNTTAITSLNSIIMVIQDASDGGASQLNVTCNTGNVLSATAPLLAAKVAATGFTINLGTVSVNPGCFEYWIVSN